MRHSNALMLIIGAIFLFFSCSKDNSSLTPDLNQSDQETTSLKAKKVHTHFTGKCTPLFHPDWPVPNTWYDEADNEPRVTGVSIWVNESEVQIDEITFELSGIAELFVGAEEFGDVGDGNYDGKWEMSWHATQTMTSSGFRIVGHAVGTGSEGNVDEMTARWKYTMDYVDGFPLDPTDPSFMYITKGKITEVP